MKKTPRHNCPLSWHQWKQRVNTTTGVSHCCLWDRCTTTKHNSTMCLTPKAASIGRRGTNPPSPSWSPPYERLNKYKVLLSRLSPRTNTETACTACNPFFFFLHFSPVSSKDIVPPMRAGTSYINLIHGYVPRSQAQEGWTSSTSYPNVCFSKYWLWKFNTKKNHEIAPRIKNCLHAASSAYRELLQPGSSGREQL